MPLYHFKCSDPACSKSFRKLFRPEVADQPRSCTCGQPMIRDPHPPSTQAVETLDNGVMARRVERLADAERLFDERAEIRKRNDQK